MAPEQMTLAIAVIGGNWTYALLIFMAVRGLAQAIWYPRLERRLT